MNPHILADLGEFGSIERIRARLPRGNAKVGIGDDAAVVTVDGTDVIVSTDALVDGNHFRLDWSTPADVGCKAVSVNVSDIAAMGATPSWLLVTLLAPSGLEVDVLDGLYAGIAEGCALYGVELVGGDMVRSDVLALSVTVLGHLDGEPLLRSGARPGDVLAVSGALGRAAAGLNLLLSGDARAVEPGAALRCIDAHRRPSARLGEGTRLIAAGATAGIDVTDGLASDARRIAEASGVGVELDALPIHDDARSVADARGWDAAQMVLAGGEDLELLVALPARTDAASLGLIPCGRVVDEGVWLVTDGDRAPLEQMGNDHFRSGP